MIIIVDYYFSFATKLTFDSGFFKRWMASSRTLKRVESKQPRLSILKTLREHIVVLLIMDFGKLMIMVIHGIKPH